ncbi:hypothetical protein DGMP_37380 [Desulfomarina profundi]|uniref:Uncharacterized protein n=1 Tax=Desulfomarina profundi TaxID=2772557 RepID=A0A8D5FSV8_9BACT|nr:hypothetical protein [Desulfomarina profundi]BCL63045.1 hypothetical protein DGMP_37380 [Desulfomarina profundi]
MRLNDHISDIQRPTPSEAQTFLTNILDIVTNSMSVDLKKPNGDLDDPYLRFFEDYYVKPNNSGPLSHVEISVRLSHIEAQIIDFFCDRQRQTTPFLFIDYAGRGKTTILKYLTYYLYQKERAIQDKILPVYISLRTHEAHISEFTKTSADQRQL